MKIYNLLFFMVALLFMGCEDTKVSTHDFSEQQIVAKNLDGSWGNASNIRTGNGVPIGILENLLITFTVDADGNPDSFLAEGANKVFTDQLGTWQWFDRDTLTKIALSGERPVNVFNINLDNNKLTLSFDVDTPGGGRQMGIGSYTVTLTRL